MISRLPSLVEASREIRGGQLSPRQLVSSCLQNMERLEHDLRAWVLVDAEGALAEADRLEELAAQGRWLGPLHGIPLGVKDIIDVAGWPTRAGSPVREDHRAIEDAAVVRRLRQAGAIVLGKTVTTQFACFDPSETRNPCDPTRTPGGSSSGSAAAVRAEMCLAALGSQTGGSIVRPAAYCGICGLKPTYAAVDMTGVVPVSGRLDHVGPLARRVADLALVMDAIAVTRPTGFGEVGAADSAANSVAAPPVLRPVVPYFWERADPEVRSCVQAVMDRYGERPLELPVGFEQVHLHHRRIMAYEAAQYHAATFRLQSDRYAPHIHSLIEEGLAIDSATFQESCAHQTAMRGAIERWLPAGQIGVTPATPSVAPRSLLTTGDPSFNSPWSYTGVPTVTFPIGEVDGMPCGIQLIGRHHADVELLEAARWLEAELAAV